MTLFAIQLVRIVLSVVPWKDGMPALEIVIGIHQMLIVIIKSVPFLVLLKTFTWLGYRTNNNFCAGLDEIVLR